ncbi:MAG TPA: hypothetical protein VFG30_03655 [Polyangiales bacterium]|jgi:hypothetical protein|nr:hypothetical protein [Polyangiales bacterium]
MLDRKSLSLCVVRSLIVSALAVSVWAGSSTSAHADTMIAADFEARVPLDLDNVSSGPAFGIRLGQQLHLPLIILTPEIGFNWGSFSDGPTIYRGILGARVGIGEILRFGVQAHIGFGHYSWDIAGEDVSHTGFTLDGGLFLDLTILPLLDLGVHAGYARVSGDAEKGLEPAQWLAFGLHAALII